MKALISILIIAGVCFGGYKFWEYWSELRRKNEGPSAEAKQAATPQRLPGMDPKLEPSLEKAQQGGATTLKQWLDTYRRTTLLRDPRLADIELDYVLLLAREDPVAAKRTFAEIRKRVPAESPVAPRLKAMEPTFQ